MPFLNRRRIPFVPGIVCMTLGLMALRTAAQDDRGLKVKEEMLSEQRIALVIGNSAYENGPLKNPVNDAKAVAEALRGLRFDVIERTDASRRQMLDGIKEFAHKIESGGVGLFYYAGHGVQIKGKNFLVPIDLHATSESDVEDDAVDAQKVLDAMAEARTRVNIVILDACRDNPYPKSSRSSGSGLAKMEARGTFLAYATAPGNVASDGTGEHGLYTEALLRHIKTPGTPIELLFKQVRRDVGEMSKGNQTPWDNSSLTGDFLFAVAGPEQASAPEAPASAVPVAATEATTSAAMAAAMGTLKVFCLQDGCLVSVDGKEMGKTQKGQYLTLSIPAGELDVVVAKDGYEPQTQKVALLPANTQEITAQLKSNQPAPAPPAEVKASPIGFVEVGTDGALEGNSFTADRKTFSYAVEIQGAPPKAAVIGTWIAESAGEAVPPNYQIVSASQEYDPAQPIMTFSMNAPDKGMPPGKYRVEIKLGDQMLHSQAFDVTPMAALVPPPVPEKGKASVIVRSNVSGDRVSINGQHVGQSGKAVHEVPPGPVKVRVEKDGYEAYEADHAVGAGEEYTFTAKLNPVQAPPSVASRSQQPSTSPPAAAAGGASPAGQWAGLFEKDGMKMAIVMQLNETGNNQIAGAAVAKAQMPHPQTGQLLSIEIQEYVQGTISGNKVRFKAPSSSVTIKETNESGQQPGDNFDCTYSSARQTLTCNVSGTPNVVFQRWQQ